MFILFLQSQIHMLYLVISENSLILFNKNGKVKELTLKYPLVQATVSDQGIIEVILEGTNSNYIQVYAKNGRLIADMHVLL